MTEEEKALQTSKETQVENPDNGEGAIQKDPKTPEEVPSTPPVPPEPVPVIDYKKKFGESTRENQVVTGKLVELEKTLGEITNDEIPTDDEMLADDSDLEFRSDFEKKQAKRMKILEKRQNKIFVNVSSITAEKKRIQALEQIASSDSRLKGKEDKFFDYATGKEGVSADILVNAFLFEVQDETPPVPETPKPEIPPSILEKGNGNGAQPPQAGKRTLSDEDLKTLRTTNQKKYNEMVKKGLI